VSGVPRSGIGLNKHAWATSELYQFWHQPQNILVAILE